MAGDEFLLVYRSLFVNVEQFYKYISVNLYVGAI